MVGVIILVAVFGAAALAAAAGARNEHDRHPGAPTSQSPRDRYSVTMGTLLPVPMPRVQAKPARR